MSDIFSNKPASIFSCWFVLHLLTSPCFGQEKRQGIYVYDCENTVPIEHVFILDSAAHILSQTDHNGFAALPASTSHVRLSKLGYTAKEIAVVTDSAYCLAISQNDLSEVNINASKIDLYAYLIQLRDKNQPDFLQKDSTILYAFQYQSWLLKDTLLLEKASGNYEVSYRNGYNFPLKLASFEGEQITDINYEYDTAALTEKSFKYVKYPTMSTLISVHNLMETKPGYDWQRINNWGEKIELRHDTGNRKIFTTLFDNHISRKFYFDSTDKIEKIEFYRPVLFLNNNFNWEQCQYKATVHYREALPRIADSFEMEYTVNSGIYPYKVYLKVALTDSAQFKRTFVSAKPGKLVYDVVLSGNSDFHTLWKRVEKFREKRFIKKVGID